MTFNQDWIDDWNDAWQKAVDDDDTEELIELVEDLQAALIEDTELKGDIKDLLRNQYLEAYEMLTELLDHEEEFAQKLGLAVPGTDHNPDSEEGARNNAEAKVDQWQKNAEDAVAARADLDAETARAELGKKQKDLEAAEEAQAHGIKRDDDERMLNDQLKAEEQEDLRLAREAEDKKAKKTKRLEDLGGIGVGLLKMLAENVESLGADAKVYDNQFRKQGLFHSLYKMANQKLANPRLARVSHAFGRLLQDFDERIRDPATSRVYAKEWMNIIRTITTFQRQIEKRVVEEGFNPSDAYLRGITKYLDQRLSDQAAQGLAARG